MNVHLPDCHKCPVALYIRNGGTPDEPATMPAGRRDGIEK
jgi:hypothetical protein